MTDTTDTADATAEAGTAADLTGVPIRASQDSANLIDAMAGRLGLWQTETEAALFLASLALTQGQGPVADDELGDDLVEIGQADEVAEGQGQAGQLTLLGLIQAPDEDLGTVLARDLPGLIEAGAAIVRPRIGGTDVAEATGQLVELLQTTG